MANLIITVISIALVAVAALMGAYYGGSAFMDGQAKARANAIVLGAEQVAGALRLYAVNNGGSLTLTNGNWLSGTSVDLVPKYLSSLPYYEFANALNYEHYFTPTELLSNNHTDFSLTPNILTLPGIPSEVCKQINLLATGTISPYGTYYNNDHDVATAFWMGINDVTVAKSDVKRFGCFIWSGAYNFVYSLF